MNFKIKTPKGTRDYGPDDMVIREYVFNTIKNVFKRHGGVEIDTPVFELKDILIGKYGEDSKLIYDLADQGGESCALRYDLTVPFARFLAMNTNIKQIKRYQIGKVYRRDQPQLSKGRYREFYQCDFDIAGNYDKMIPDAEVLKIICEILNELKINFNIKVNHRKLLNEILEKSGVIKEKYTTICSSIDKLDKVSWEQVENEMINEKGLNKEITENIKSFINCDFDSIKDKLDNVEDLKLLFNYLEAFSIKDKIIFDPSLARGLDYYTGLIFEAVYIDENTKNNIGSIAGGGRYDNLVEMFNVKQIPCVGFSIGVERIFNIIDKNINKNNVQVYICSIGNNIMYVMKLASELWENNIKTEYSYKENTKFLNQIDYCEKNKIQYAIIIGEDEIKNNKIKLRNVSTRYEIIVNRDNVVDLLKSSL